MLITTDDKQKAHKKKERLEAPQKRLISGLEAVSVNQVVDKQRGGYAIYTKICLRCGTKVDHPDNKETISRHEKCPSCFYNRFTIVEAMHPKQTEAIINKTLKYKCVQCGKLHDQPTQCCLAYHEVQGDKMLFGYYCTGCKRIYSQKVECCTGFDMYEGFYKPSSYEDYVKAPKFLLPQNEQFYNDYLAKHMEIKGV